MAETKKRKRYVRFSKNEYRIDDVVPVSAIYECSECEEIAAFKKDEAFTPCEECGGGSDQTWYRTNEFIHFFSKNLNTEFDRVETFGLWLSDLISEFAGTIGFVFFHVVWFGLWIYANVGGSLFGFSNFDVYPFGLLTMIVSLEAIFLSTFILISQNRQAQKSELRAELDYQTNINTEKNVAEVLALLHELRDEDKLLAQKADEVLEDANIRLETPLEGPKPKRRRRPRKRKRKGKKGVIESAGIDVVRD